MAQQLENVARVRNCVVALAKMHLAIYKETILDVFNESLQLGMVYTLAFGVFAVVFAAAVFVCVQSHAMVAWWGDSYGRAKVVVGKFHGKSHGKYLWWCWCRSGG